MARNIRIFKKQTKIGDIKANPNIYRLKFTLTQSFTSYQRVKISFILPKVNSPSFMQFERYNTYLIYNRY